MAAGRTYTPIARTTLNSDTQNITFSSIPATYTDLVLVMNVKAASATYGLLRVNSDSNTNYSSTNLRGDGSSASSRRQTNLAQFDEFFYNTISTSQFIPVIININNYSNTNTYKTFISRTSDAGVETIAAIGLWRSTAAINTIYVATSSGNIKFVAGSTFTLYGIAAA